MKKWKIGWGIARECNMRCGFCYSAEARVSEKSPRFEDYVRFFNENKIYIDSINYGTGESTLNQNWFSLIKYIRETAPEIRQSLTTNGYLSERVKDELCDEIFTSAIDEVDVSLDFGIPEKHCKFRGQIKAYEWAINTLEYLQKKNNKLITIVMIGTEETLQKDNIDQIFAIATQYHAIVRINMYRPTNSNARINALYTVSYDTLMKALYYISQRYHILSISDPLFSAVLLEDQKIIDPSGLDSVRILPDGSITPSTYLITEQYRTCSISEPNVLRNITDNHLFDSFRGAEIPVKCKNCKLVDCCRGGAFDRRYLWYNTYNEPDPYCPFNANNYIPDFKLKLMDCEFSSVHDGYLPTLFFMP